MSNLNIALPVVLAGLLCVGGLSGCATQQLDPMSQSLSCKEALGAPITGINEMKQILDKEVLSRNLDECWRPLIEKGLKGRQDIPVDHLRRAVKEFNQHQDNDVFHVASYRYLAEIAKGNSPYRVADRQFLESYTSYVIQHATGADEQHLVQTRLLCQRLDKELYRKFFK